MPRKNYSGLEIDMLAVGDADCILVTRWANSVATRILIDGGRKSHAGMIRSFLSERDIHIVDHVVNTHLDADHAGGLIELVSDESIEWGCVWMHIPGAHTDETRLAEQLVQYGRNKYAMMITASLQHSKDLLQACREREIAVNEPFEGETVGFMTVLGPSKAYYRELLPKFNNLEKYIGQLQLNDSKERTLKLASILNENEDRLLDNPTTSSENNSSCILLANYSGYSCLFTGDAGVDALSRVTAGQRLKGVHWMQVPHHGSRRNINVNLIEHFCPKLAYVSASGNNGHPGAAVVDAFKIIGSRLYGTYHPEVSHLLYSIGDVPLRPTYVTATQL